MPFPPEVIELREKVRNWGRWGADDEIGTLNLITDDVVKSAASEVRSGKRFSLALPLDADGPQIGYTPGRENPTLEMVAINSPYPPDDLEAFAASDDKVTTSLQAATHWDALSHVSSGGKMYNGVPADAVTAAGTTKLGIEKVSSLLGRGVLLDVARAKGQDAMTSTYAVTGADLDAACELGKVKVQAGDIVLLRTGKITQFLAGDKVAYCDPNPGNPGPSLQSVQWFRDHDVAALATDNYQFEVFPSEREDAVLPIHILHLVDMGMTQGQNFNLEALAADCADDGRYTVFLSATPEPFTHAVSGLVHPVAVK
jgi:kynurenine formamidase